MRLLRWRHVSRATVGLTVRMLLHLPPEILHAAQNAAQLRQRVAWALAQIYVNSKDNQNDQMTEKWVTYYDIFEAPYVVCSSGNPRHIADSPSLSDPCAAPPSGLAAADGRDAPGVAPEFGPDICEAVLDRWHARAAILSLRGHVPHGVVDALEKNDETGVADAVDLAISQGAYHHASDRHVEFPDHLRHVVLSRRSGRRCEQRPLA